MTGPPPRNLPPGSLPPDGAAQNGPDLNPLGRLLSLVALLAAALYFTGWIYRWTYFGFFHLEVTTLSLPLESFYLAAFQALLGGPLAVMRSIAVFAVAGVGTLAAVKRGQRLAQKLPFWKVLSRGLSRLRPAPTDSLRFLASLVDELIIVLFLLTVLFWLAHWQARVDAWRDAVNATSTLPVVTVAIANKNAALGRQVDDPLINPSGFRIIGDRTLYDRLLGQELTDLENPDQPRVWRLLIDQDGYFCIFPALPAKDNRLSFPVLIVYESANGDQLTILAPDPTKDDFEQ